MRAVNVRIIVAIFGISGRKGEGACPFILELPVVCSTRLSSFSVSKLGIMTEVVALCPFENIGKSSVYCNKGQAVHFD